MRAWTAGLIPARIHLSPYLAPLQVSLPPTYGLYPSRDQLWALSFCLAAPFQGIKPSVSGSSDVQGSPGQGAALGVRWGSPEKRLLKAIWSVTTSPRHLLLAWAPNTVPSRDCGRGQGLPGSLSRRKGRNRAENVPSVGLQVTAGSWERSPGALPAGSHWDQLRPGLLAARATLGSAFPVRTLWAGRALLTSFR